MASAKLGENAYASPADATTGVALADRFTEQAIRWLSSTGSEPGATWGHFVHQMARARTGSTLEVYEKAGGGPDWKRAPIRACLGDPPGEEHSLTFAEL